MTSGTMTPFNSWERELKIPFPFTIATEHVINSALNLLPGIVLKGQSGCVLNLSYDNRNNFNLIKDIYTNLG